MKVGANDEYLGSIPACAGEPIWFRLPHRNARVYPRVCGGATWQGAFGSGATGLSPRVRGSHKVKPLGLTGIGSIPACAGEPPNRVSCEVCPWVYPRVCGGATSKTSVITKCSGLSPRVRGSRQEFIAKYGDYGSIPACAGEPRRAASCWPPDRVYPRVCGGAISAALSASQGEGLSPRVRGSRK